GSGFAGEVPGIELLEGSVDVVDVEPDALNDPVVGVDLNNVEHLGADFAGPHAAGRTADTNEGEARSAGRHDDRRDSLGPHFGDGSHFRDVVISTVPDAGIHDSTTIFCGNIVGEQ